MSNAQILSLRDQLIKEGIQSANEHEKRDYRREGCIDGFNVCRNLESDEDFDAVLALRHAEERKLQQDMMTGQVTNEDYWRYRCATVQVEFIHERLKVLWGTYGMSGTHSARAVVHIDHILKRRAGLNNLKM